MKEMRFFIDTPSIEISRLSENNDFHLDFEIKKEDFAGKLTVNIDPESIEWDTHDGEDEYPQSFSRLLISLSTKQGISHTTFLENAYFIVIEYLDNFFRFIQIELGQYWVDVGPVRDWGLFTFLGKTNAKWIIEGKEENVGIPIGGYKKVKVFLPQKRKFPDWSDGIDVNQLAAIKSWIEKPKLVDLEKQLLADAKRYLSHGDYKSSSILTITALERPLEDFVKGRCKAKGISKNTLDTYDKNHFVGDYLKLLLPLVLEPDELTKWLEDWLKSTKHWYGGKGKFDSNQIIDWAVELNKARNKAVHEGITPEFETIDKGIFAIEAIYEFVKEGNE